MRFRLALKSMTLDDFERPKRHSCRNKQEPCYRRENRAVNFDTYRNLQRRRAVSLPQHGFLVFMLIVLWRCVNGHITVRQFKSLKR